MINGRGRSRMAWVNVIRGRNEPYWFGEVRLIWKDISEFFGQEPVLKPFLCHSQPYIYVKCSLHAESAAPHLAYTNNIYSHFPAQISQSASSSTTLTSLLNAWISEPGFRLIRVTDPQLRTCNSGFYLVVYDIKGLESLSRHWAVPIMMELIWEPIVCE